MGIYKDASLVPESDQKHDWTQSREPVKDIYSGSLAQYDLDVQQARRNLTVEQEVDNARLDAQVKDQALFSGMKRGLDIPPSEWNWVNQWDEMEQSLDWSK